MCCCSPPQRWSCPRTARFTSRKRSTVTTRDSTRRSSVEALRRSERAGKDPVMGSRSAWQTDDQLHDAVKRQLGWEPDIHADNIAVLVTDSVVTLAGFA